MNEQDLNAAVARLMGYEVVDNQTIKVGRLESKTMPRFVDNLDGAFQACLLLGYEVTVSTGLQHVTLYADPKHAQQLIHFKRHTHSGDQVLAIAAALCEALVAAEGESDG